MKEKTKIVIVDDNEGHLHRTKQVVDLQNSCTIIGCFTSVAQAILHIPNLHPDLILMDYDLGAGQTGEALFDAVRGKNTKVIYITQYADKQLVVSGKPNVRGAVYKLGVEFNNSLIAAIKAYQTTMEEIRDIELTSSPLFSKNSETVVVRLHNNQSIDLHPDEVIYIEQEQDYPFIKVCTLQGTIFETIFNTFKDAESTIKGTSNSFFRVLSKGGNRTINKKYYHGVKLPNHKIQLSHGSKEWVVECATRTYAVIDTPTLNSE